MKNRALFLIFTLFLSCTGVVLLLRRNSSKESSPANFLPVVTTAVPPTEAAPAREMQETLPSFDRTLTLWVKNGEEVQEMPLHDYLLGVLLAEMPANFSEEALKAQAVASRTYTLRKASAKKHPYADICTVSACCQAWCSVDAYLEKGGTQENIEKVSAAIEETDALVVTYSGKLIDATFFSCAGGSTEAASAVWGNDVPYLQAVSSPEDVPHYSQTLCISAETFTETLRSLYPEATLTGEPSNWFGTITYTPGAGIQTVSIGGLEVSGVQLRRLFSLRSTDITITTEENNIFLSTDGYGHRVGLSQYGADAMAQAGQDFEQILLHYYQGTQIQRLTLTGQR